MSRSTPYVLVTCDECGDSQEVELCALARGAWDERYVNRQLEQWDWAITDEQDICPGCAEEQGLEGTHVSHR